MCVLAVPPHHIYIYMYICGRGRGASRGAPSRSNPTWAPPTSRPPPFHKCRRGKEREGESVSMYPHRPNAEAFDNAVDVVKLLLVPIDQAPNVRHLRVLHTFSSMMSLELLIQKCRGRVASARRRGDGDGDVIRPGLRLSTMTL